MSTKRELLRGVINRVALCGVELEGGWAKPPKDIRIENDGSVKFDIPKPQYRINSYGDRELVIDPTVAKLYPPTFMKGEIVMRPPMKATELGDWMRKYYPSHVNETCGLHVHMSFHYKLNYSRLMTPEYMHQMIRELGIWGEKNKIPANHMLWNRLNPDHPWTHEHCSHLFLGDKQSLVREKDYRSRGTPYSRYTFINYPEAQHHTVECRGLPMFETADQAISAVDCVIDTTNRFLSKLRQRERAVKMDIAIQPPEVVEIGRLVV